MSDNTKLYRLVDDLGDARNAFGHGDERFSLIFRVNKAPEVHLAILYDHIAVGAMREIAAQFLALAEKQGTTVPIMIGHRNMGHTLE